MKLRTKALAEGKQDTARQSSAKAERSKTNAEDAVGRRSFLKGAALLAGGTAVGTLRPRATACT